MGLAELGAPRASDARAALRGATHEVHLKMHALEPFRRIEAQTLDRPGYAALLQRLLLFHSAIEQALPPQLSAQGTGSARIDRLHQDLADLGAAPFPGSLVWTPPPLPDASLGCLYVTQGSILGGKLIFRQLDYLFASELEGRRFFAGDPQDRLAWRRLCAGIERRGAFDERGTVLAGMIEGALAAFALFERCMEAEA